MIEINSKRTTVPDLAYDISMIKRIHSNQLLPGMYIHDLNCGWMEHPFAFNSFKVNDEKAVEKIIASGIHELYIDSSKGLDVENAQTHDEYHAEIHEQITSLVENHDIKPSSSLAEFHEETVHAKAVLYLSYRYLSGRLIGQIGK